MIPHKMQYINGYICRCLALFFISGCIRLPEYHILQFHSSFFSQRRFGFALLEGFNEGSQPEPV